MKKRQTNKIVSLIPFVFLLIALMFPIVVLRDPPSSSPPPVPLPSDYDSSNEIYLVGELDAGFVSYRPHSGVLPFWGIVGLVLLQMHMKPRLKLDHDLWINIVLSFLIIAVWSVFVELIFISPSSRIPESYPLVPIAGLVLVPLYRAYKFDWFQKS